MSTPVTRHLRADKNGVALTVEQGASVDGIQNAKTDVPASITIEPNNNGDALVILADLQPLQPVVLTYDLGLQ